MKLTPTFSKTLPGITLGCDPEFFLFTRSPEGDKIYLGAEQFLKGTKEEPFKLSRGAVQVDGMAGEFNIDPVSTYEEWEENISTTLDEIKRMLPEHVFIDFVPTVTFDDDEWERASDKAKELGCSPDFNAWTREQNKPPHRTKKNKTLCTGAGHVHIGWTQGIDLSDERHQQNCVDLVRQLDTTLGVHMLRTDHDRLRQSLYGKAGAFRYKPYGVEYRTPSNVWVSDIKGRYNVWEMTNMALHLMGSKYYPDMIDTEEFVSEFNRGNVRECTIKMNRLGFFFPS